MGAPFFSQLVPQKALQSCLLPTEALQQFDSLI
jgi:hypothetical protein